jgi:hypothetical protein
MNARSWFLVGTKLLGIYLILEALGAVPPILLYLDAPHRDAEHDPGALLLQVMRTSVFPLVVLFVINMFVGLILVYKTSRIGDYLRFYDDNPSFGMTEQVFLRSGLTILGLVWAVTGLEQGLSRLTLPSGAMPLAAQVQPWIEMGLGLVLIIWSREIAFWAQRDRRF